MTTVPILLGFNGSNYQVTRSLRFRSSASAYLNRTPSAASNRKTWTWSGWVKRGTLGSNVCILGAGANLTDYTEFLFQNANILQLYVITSSTNRIVCSSSAVFRDPSAWYHVVLAVDTTQSTNSNGVKIYVNGVQQTLSFASYTQNVDTAVNNTVAQNIGQVVSNEYFDGYIAEVNFVDGQQLTPSSFGYFDLYGVWQPKKYNGTFGTNGFYLPFSNTTSTTTLVADSSGNGNNWTANNISLTAGTTYDSMIDSPTNYADGGNGRGNYAVMNPLTKGSYATLSGGNLNTSGNTAADSGNLRSSFAFTTGKWYAEFTVTGVSSTYPQYGIMQSSDARSPNNGLPQAGYGSLSNSVAYGADGNKIITNTSSAYGSSYTTNDVIGIAIDADNGAVYFSKNGTFQNSGVPTSGSSKTGAALTWTGSSVELVIAIAEYNGSGTATNFGQRSFTYTPPSGYLALNTQNLPPSAVPYGAPYMNAITYTGYGPLVPSGLGILTKRNASTQNVSKSLRFRASASAYLNRTFGTPTNNLKWTWSGWVKRGTLSSVASGILFSGGDGTGNNGAYIAYQSSDVLSLWQYSGGVYNVQVNTSALFRDPSAWYHVVIIYDSSNSTSTDRVQIWVNGVRNSVTYTTGPFAQNTASQINVNARPHFLSKIEYTTQYLDGYLAEVNFVDGQALTPSSFGQTNSDGIWVPKAYTGTYGTNGFYLPFTNTTSTTTLGNDSSGNGNNFTVNNISLTAGTTYDSMIDSPTDYASAGNYCTMNPLDSLSGTASNGNLLWTAGAAQSDIRGTITIPSSGKFYMECTVGSTTNATSAVSFGLATSTVALNSSNAVSGLYQLYASSSGYLSLNGTNVSSSLGVWTAGDTLQIAVDVDNTKMWLGKNGTWYDSAGGSTGNPSTGANATSTASMVGLFPFSNCYSNNATWNMGQRSFVYAAPTGFTTLNTYNITAPSTTWFSSANNSGNASATAYPDFVWIKARSSAQNHSLNDTLRGPTLNLLSNSTAAEAGASTMFAVNKYGLTLGNDASVNSSSYTDVMWGWQGGNGTTSTNTSGTITSTVSASTTSGVSIVTYTGTGANATVGHSLGVAPSFIIVRSRNNGGATNWAVWHTSFSSTEYIFLNSTAAKSSSGGAALWNSTLPSSTVFSIGTDTNTNYNTTNMLAYCFAAIRGFSAFGSYTGNGSTDGPFVYTGFKPRWIIMKCSTTAGLDWNIVDTSRNLYNVTTSRLWADLSNAEDSTDNVCDILSNGFKLRSTNTNTNASGATFIYAAFAENPFNMSRAR